MLIDSGSTVNIVNQNIAKTLDVKIHRCHTSLVAFNSKSPLPVVGKFKAQVRYKGHTTKCDFIVVEGNGCSILGYKSACDLRVLKIVYSVTENHNKEGICKRFPRVFHGVGKMKNVDVKLHIDLNVKPVKQTHRRIPFHQRHNVEKCLKDLLDQDIIEQAEGPTPWINPVVLVPKSDGGTRMCIDMREANMAISRERHVMPTIDEIIHDLNGSVVFSKVDLAQGYHQLSLDPESRYITTFTTHKGLFRYKRLSFGINAAAEKFQDIIATAISDIPNTKNISDDIIIYGKSVADHDQALHTLLQRCEELNLTLNKHKCEFYMDEVNFYGWIFTAQGIKPDPGKVDSILKLCTPSNVSECRSLLGMTNYVARLILNYADLVRPIRELTKNDVNFDWGDAQEKAFSSVKSQLVSANVISYFDPNKETCVIVDASPHGLAGILTQEGHVIAYASKALSPTESRYSQIEREALAISWACQHFRMYLLGKHFSVYSDHKPLLTIFNNPRSKASTRIDNWRLRLQRFNFTVCYGKGSTNPADFMSRYVHHGIEAPDSVICESSEQYINFILQESMPRAISKGVLNF